MSDPGTELREALNGLQLEEEPWLDVPPMQRAAIRAQAARLLELCVREAEDAAGSEDAERYIQAWVLIVDTLRG